MKRLLVYGDTPVANTGLGIVNRHLLKALHATGEYQITVCGINHLFPHKPELTAEYPYTIYAPTLGGSSDFLGRNLMAQLLEAQDYDIVLFNIDYLYLVPFEAQLRKARKRGAKVACFTPIDRRVVPGEHEILRKVDLVATYTEYGRRELEMADKRLRSIEVVYLGCDLEAFHPLDPEEAAHWRDEYFHLPPETFLVMSLGQNQWRKDLARTMRGFLICRQHLAEAGIDSRLYLHSVTEGNGGDLRRQARALGLEEEYVVNTPAGFSSIEGFPQEVLNRLYAAADAVVSTSMGEGWGLSTTEAFATGTPFLGPRNTAITELVGEGQERGWLANQRGWITFYGEDNAPRPLTDENDWAMKLVQIAVGDTSRKTGAAQEWVRQYPWERMGQRWVELMATL